MMDIAIYITSFLSVLALVIGFALTSSRFIESLPTNKSANGSFVARVFGPLVLVYARRLAGHKHKQLRQRTEDKLRHAGRPFGSISGAEFIAAARLLAYSSLVLSFFALLLIAGIGLGSFLTAILLSGAVYLLSFFYLDTLIAERKHAITRQFPYFLDLGVMTMEAGASLNETLEIYASDNPNDELADELSICFNEIRMGKTLADAFASLKARVTADEVHATVNAVLQGQKLGTPIGKVFRDQAEAMRFRRSQAAERASEELKVRLQGPAMLMVISVLLLILGPALLEVGQGGLF